MGGVFNPVNLNTYHYAGNNPVKYNDPNGKDIAHFLPYPGWSHDAPQSAFGYHDFYDNLSDPVFGFDLDATSFELQGMDVTLRLWKGDYSSLAAGGGGEIGLYSANGAALSKDEMSDFGLKSTTMRLFDKRDNSLVAGYKEEGQSFWTTAFNPFKNPGKDNLYTENTFEFEAEGQAEIFTNAVKGSREGAEDYPHNRNESISVTSDGNKVIITWGKPEEK